MKEILFTTLVLGALVHTSAMAQSQFECTSGSAIRRVEIVYESSAAVPCEVHYIKATEAPGSDEVLWNAVNEGGYCEARAQEFVARLSSLGWTCSAEQAAPAADDSAVLTPAEDQQ